MFICKTLSIVRVKKIILIYTLFTIRTINILIGSSKARVITTFKILYFQPRVVQQVMGNLQIISVNMSVIGGFLVLLASYWLLRHRVIPKG